MNTKINIDVEKPRRRTRMKASFYSHKAAAWEKVETFSRARKEAALLKYDVANCEVAEKELKRKNDALKRDLARNEKDLAEARQRTSSARPEERDQKPEAAPATA